MNRTQKIAGATLVALLSLTGAAAATQIGGSIILYLANFDWRTSSGAQAYPTFTNVWGQLTHYEPISIVSGFTSCTEIGSNTLNGTDQVIWYEQSPGAWALLANNVSNGTDPHAVVYSDGSAAVQLRIADLWATPAGYVQVRSQYFPQSPSYTWEQTCDIVAFFGNKPYLKMKNGVMTVANVH